MVRQFSEQEVEEFGAFLLYRYITEDHEKVKKMEIREIVRLGLVDWLQRKGEYDDGMTDDPPEPVLIQPHQNRRRANPGSIP